MLPRLDNFFFSPGTMIPSQTVLTLTNILLRKDNQPAAASGASGNISGAGLSKTKPITLD